MSVFRRVGVLLPLLPLLLAAEITAAPPDTSPGPRMWTYKLEAQVTRGKEEHSAELQLEAYDLTVEGDRFVACVLSGRDEDIAGYFPVGSIRAFAAGDQEVSFEQPRPGAITARVHPVLFHDVDPKRLAAAAEGTSTQQFLQVAKFKKIPLKYKSAPIPDSPGKILYEDSLSGDVSTSIGPMQLRLAKFERRLTFAADDHRLLEGTWLFAEEKTVGARTTPTERRLRATLINVKPLSPDEAKDILAEYEAFEKAATRAFQGGADTLKEAEKALDAYEKKYTEGKFARATNPMQMAIAQRASALEGRAKPIELIQEKVLDRPAPDFTLEDIEGKEVTLSALKDKVVLLAFWGVACKECRKEAPHLNRLYETYKDRGFVVLGVNAYNDSMDQVKKFCSELSITYPLLSGGVGISRASYFAPDFPASYWIDKTGKVVHFEIGWKEDKSQQKVAEYEARIKKLLGL